MLLGADVTVLKAGMGLTAPHILPNYAIPKPLCLGAAQFLQNPSVSPSQLHLPSLEAFPTMKTRWRGTEELGHLAESWVAPGPSSRAGALCPTPPSTPNKVGISPSPLHAPPCPPLPPAPVPVPGSLPVLPGTRNSLCLQPTQGNSSPQHAHF